MFCTDLELLLVQPIKLNDRERGTCTCLASRSPKGNEVAGEGATPLRAGLATADVVYPPGNEFGCRLACGTYVKCIKRQCRLWRLLVDDEDEDEEDWPGAGGRLQAPPRQRDLMWILCQI